MTITLVIPSVITLFKGAVRGGLLQLLISVVVTVPVQGIG